jgi:hypothetical protein
MALGPNVIFEVETGGNDTANGGGFDPGVTFAPGDLSASSGLSGTPTLTASNYQFATGDVGAWIFVVGGTSWIPGWYQITALSGTSAKVNAAIGAAVLYPSMMPNSTSGVATVSGPSGGQWALDYSQQSAAQVVIDNSAIKCTTPAASSNTLTFTQGYTPSERDLGNFVQITNGTNVNTGIYEITGFAGSPTNTWTLAGAQTLTKSGGAGGSAITGGMGGAFASLGMAAFAAVPGNRAFVKTGSYIISGGTPNTAGARVTWPGGSSASLGSFIIGYGTVRGDFGAPPTLTAASGFSGAALLTTGTGNYVANLVVNGAGQGTTQGIATGTTGSILYRCKVENCTSNGINAGDAGSMVVLCELTGCASQPAGVGGQWYYSAIHDNTGGGLSLGNVGNAVGFCLVTNNTGTGMDGVLFASAASGGCAFNTTVYNSGRDGIRLTAGTVGIVLLNNLCVDNASMDYDASAATDQVLMVNNGWYGGGGGIGSNLSGNKIIGTVALTAFPFVNALANNFALNTATGGGAAATAAGIGAGTALVPGLPTPSFIDLGAAQVPSSATALTNQQVAIIDQTRQTGQFTVTAQTINFGKPVTSASMVNAINDQAVYQALLWAGGRYTSSGGNNNPCLFSSPDGINWTEQTGAVGFGAGDAEVKTLFASANGSLYLGTSALSGSSPKLFQYSGATWTLLTTAFGGNVIPTSQLAVRSMADGPDGLVYASMVAVPTNAPQLWNNGGTGGKWQQVTGTPWTNSVTTVTLAGIPGPMMYASTDNIQTGGAGGIYATATPAVGSSWGTPINTTFFTTVRTGVVEAHKLVSFKGQFFTSTHDTANGAGVWFSNDQGKTWTLIPATAFGFGIGPTEEDAYDLYIYDGALFVGTLNSSYGGGIWFTQNGLDWFRLGSPGMGDPLNNSGYYNLIAFQNRLWIAPHGSTTASSNISRPYSVQRFADTGAQGGGGAGPR